MKNHRFIWIPPAQTTLRQLAELNRQAYYFKSRSKSVKSKRSKSDNLVLKKLVNYQSELASIRVTLSHHVEAANDERWRIFALDWARPSGSELRERSLKIEELISTGIERLALGDRSDLNERFESLENDLVFRYCDDICIVKVKTPKDVTDVKSAILESVQARINEHLHHLQEQIGIAISRVRLGLAIDRRARFRAIVHFIFKNLDDYDSKDYVLQAA